jgi:predicted RND superfamily exporter protein
MGLLIGSGNTLHIMSSMIPIFLMPIAVVDSIHILSEFFDNYQKTRNRQQTIEHVMSKLFAPMLYTSLTSAVGFLSLALTPIPPVQVFGLFVGFGIMLAWVLTMLFVPAYVMLLKESSLDNFGSGLESHSDRPGATDRLLTWTSRFTYTRAKLIVVFCLILIGIAGYGISLIQINDNPVKWFTTSHPIRVADRVLNQHFGGTYEAYLVIEPQAAAGKNLNHNQARLLKLEEDIKRNSGDNPDDQQIRKSLAPILAEFKTKQLPAAELFARLSQRLQKLQDEAVSDDIYDAWSPIIELVDKAAHENEIFKNPAVLNYLDQLQEELKRHPAVGKSNSIVQVVKKVHQELLSGNPEEFRIPKRQAAVAQCLLSFQNSHKPEDLWHLVTPDYKRANLWVQLHSGDNQDMEEVIRIVKNYTTIPQPPVPLQFKWAGLTYIYVVWQDKMVAGMLRSLLGSFVIVLIMMVVLFRSPVWGLIAMIPLTVTITLIYGLIGLIGKDYDMPVAVLSSLTLGLAVDFAIHFLERSRMAYKECGSWEKALSIMFAEPARAITRNIIVIAVGFTPLLLAPLMPYKTVGVFLASIMLISGLATIVILPALLSLGKNFLFRKL